MSRAGSIKQDASGRWFFVIDVPAPNGKRRQIRRRGFRIKDDAKNALTDALIELRTGPYVRRRR